MTDIFADFVDEEVAGETVTGERENNEVQESDPIKVHVIPETYFIKLLILMKDSYENPKLVTRLASQLAYLSKHGPSMPMTTMLDSKENLEDLDYHITMGRPVAQYYRGLILKLLKGKHLVSLLAPDDFTVEYGIGVGPVMNLFSETHILNACREKDISLDTTDIVLRSQAELLAETFLGFGKKLAHLPSLDNIVPQLYYNHLKKNAKKEQKAQRKALYSFFVSFLASGYDFDLFLKNLFIELIRIVQTTRMPSEQNTHAKALNLFEKVRTCLFSPDGKTVKREMMLACGEPLTNVEYSDPDQVQVCEVLSLNKISTARQLYQFLVGEIRSFFEENEAYPVLLIDPRKMKSKLKTTAVPLGEDSFVVLTALIQKILTDYPGVDVFLNTNVSSLKVISTQVDLRVVDLIIWDYSTLEITFRVVLNDEHGPLLRSSLFKKQLEKTLLNYQYAALSVLFSNPLTAQLKYDSLHSNNSSIGIFVQVPDLKSLRKKESKLVGTSLEELFSEFELGERDLDSEETQGEVDFVRPDIRSPADLLGADYGWIDPPEPAANVGGDSE